MVQPASTDPKHVAVKPETLIGRDTDMPQKYMNAGRVIRVEGPPAD